jgi:hypothetical protein
LDILKDCDLRVEWSREKLVELRTVIKEAGEKTLEQADLSDPSTRPDAIFDFLWALPRVQIRRLASECIFHMRTALEYIPANLARVAGADNSYTKFPICISRVNFDLWVRKHGRTFGSEHVALFKKYQPFLRDERDSIDLCTLNDLSNADKHRELIQMRGVGGTFSYSPCEPRNVNPAIQVLFYNGFPLVPTLENLCDQVAEIVRAFRASKE